MKLSEKQIKYLYKFTEQHYVEYYDLQTELVDHLANGIEQQWQEKPFKIFDEALRQEFKKYGIFGFTDLVEERQKAMSKKYGKLVLRLVKQYFTFPKIAQTFFLGLLLYIFIKFAPYKEYIILGFMIGVFMLVFYKFYQWNRIFRKRKKEKQKIWMYENIIFSCGSSLAIFQVMVQLPLHVFPTFRMRKILEHEMGVICLCFFIVFLGVMAYVLTVEIPKIAKKHIAKEHPEYQIV